jgi:hypothetical protein
LQLEAPKAAMSRSAMKLSVTRAGVQKRGARRGAAGCLEEVM